MLNDVWTFKDKRIGNIWKRLLKFHMSSASGGVIQYIVVISIANTNDIDMDKSFVVDKNTSSFTTVPSPPTTANFSNLDIKGQ